MDIFKKRRLISARKRGIETNCIDKNNKGMNTKVGRRYWNLFLKKKKKDVFCVIIKVTKT